MKRKNFIEKLFSYIFLTVILIMTFIPILYTLFSSFKTNAEILVKMGNFFPDRISFENYRTTLSSADFYLPLLLKNSLVYTIMSAFISVAVSTMAGYSFEKGDFPFKKTIFACLSFLMFVKLGGISIYATFDILKILHIKRNLYSLIFVHIFSVHIVNIYLVRSYVKSIPDGMLEAARIDGCSFFRSFLLVGLPVIKPIIATIAILSLKTAWNEYIMPTIFTVTKPEQRTLIVGLMSLKNSTGAASAWNLILAGSVIAMLPMFIAYIFGNKYFVSGLTAGAEKG